MSDNTEAETMTEAEAAAVGPYVSYKVTLIYGENGRYTFADGLPEETVEAFCHGVLREGIEIELQPGVRRFVRPFEIALTEIAQ